MDDILVPLITTLSEFLNNPLKVLEIAGNHPLEVHIDETSHFYAFSSELYEALTEMVFDLQIEPTIKNRLGRLSETIEINLSDL